MPDNPRGHSVPDRAPGAPHPVSAPASDWDTDAIESLDDNLAERLEVDPTRGDVKG